MLPRSEVGTHHQMLERSNMNEHRMRINIKTTSVANWRRPPYAGHGTHVSSNACRISSTILQLYIWLLAADSVISAAATDIRQAKQRPEEADKKEAATAAFPTLGP